MSSSFALELDTTSPVIEIVSPQYTIPQIETDIFVRASEGLSAYQEFYIIDAQNRRHDLIFYHDGDQYHGIHNFNDIALGIAKIYARVKDDVGNISSLEMAPINVRMPAAVKVEVYELTRSIVETENTMNIQSSEISRQIHEYEVVRNISTGEKTRNVEVSP